MRFAHSKPVIVSTSSPRRPLLQSDADTLPYSDTAAQTNHSAPLADALLAACPRDPPALLLA
jgi:hypothetical protein